MFQSQANNSQAVVQERANFYSNVLEFFWKLILPAVVVVIGVNVIFKQCQGGTPQQVLQKALMCGNRDAAIEAYQVLIAADFCSIEYHRGYILLLEEQPSESRGCGELSARNIITQYTAYAESLDPIISDVGYYGLGCYYSSNEDYDKALASFIHVKNPHMKYLNNSLGYIYMQRGQNQKARDYFKREIELKGFIEGAYENLATLYFTQDDIVSLNELVDAPQVRRYLPPHIVRYVHLQMGQFIEYAGQCFRLDYITISGMLASLLTAFVWFRYFQKLDVFEPEKLRYLLLVFLGGVLFSMECMFFYDYLDFVLGFSLGNGVWGDLLYCIGGIGLIEETLKILPFLLILRYTREINESIDYIIYAAVSALGFSFMENLIYFQDPGLRTIVSRTLSAVLLHVSLSATVGYGLFYAKYKKKSRHPWIYFMVFFTIACIVHGLYDFWLLSETLFAEMKILSVLILIISISVLSNMIKNALNQSEFNQTQMTRVVGLSRHLVYWLSGVILLQYVLIAWKFGPCNANIGMPRAMLLCYYPLVIVLLMLGRIHIRKKKWVPLIELKNTKDGTE